MSRPSICDALLAVTPGAMTFAIMSARLGGSLVASDGEAMAAMRLSSVSWRSRAALAAIMQGRLRVDGDCVAVLLSGANVDAALYARALQAE